MNETIMIKGCQIRKSAIYSVGIIHPSYGVLPTVNLNIGGLNQNFTFQTLGEAQNEYRRVISYLGWELDVRIGN